MVMTTAGQMQNHVAAQTYRLMGEFADKMVRTGQIAAAERNAFWARHVAERLVAMNMPIPKEVASHLGGVGQAGAAGAAPGSMGTAAARIAGGTFAFALAAFLVEAGIDVKKWSDGEITGLELELRVVENGVKATSAASFGTAGAWIGSFICPGLGTAVGGALGGIVGTFLGKGWGRKFARG